MRSAVAAGLACVPATAACRPVGAAFAGDVLVVVERFAAASFAGVVAVAPPVAFWTFALAASLAAAAPLAAFTSFARPVAPGAVGSGGSSAGGFGLSTVNQSAHTASTATRAMRKGGLSWATPPRSAAAAAT